MYEIWSECTKFALHWRLVVFDAGRHNSSIKTKER
jgi:hypothetical protein